MLPGSAEHLAAGALEQRVVHSDHQRGSWGQEAFDDQAGQSQADLVSGPVGNPTAARPTLVWRVNDQTVAILGGKLASCVEAAKRAVVELSRESEPTLEL